MTMAQLLALIDVETDGKPAGYGEPASPSEWMPEGTVADWAMLGSLPMGG